jgi:hypothetical protein
LDVEPRVLTTDDSAAATLVRARLEQRLRELEQMIARIPLAELQRPSSATAGKAAPTAVFADLAQKVVELRGDVAAGREQHSNLLAAAEQAVRANNDELAKTLLGRVLHSGEFIMSAEATLAEFELLIEEIRRAMGSSHSRSGAPAG